MTEMQGCEIRSFSVCLQPQMVSINLSPDLQIEENLVAELARLGIRYLSRLSDVQAKRAIAPSNLIADLTRQPSSRVRAALISLFLAQPEYAKYVLAALKQVNEKEAITLKFFYAAATLLQRKYADKFLTGKVPNLPDLFLRELGISGVSIEEQLSKLEKKHQEVSGQYINWKGSYENAARHLLRQWELEKRWNESLQKR